MIIKIIWNKSKSFEFTEIKLILSGILPFEKIFRMSGNVGNGDRKLNLINYN